jgi:hypothetical protein
MTVHGVGLRESTTTEDEMLAITGQDALEVAANMTFTRIPASEVRVGHIVYSAVTRRLFTVTGVETYADGDVWLTGNRDYAMVFEAGHLVAVKGA